MTAVASIGASVPELPADEAHLWHARAGDGRALAERLLSADELARAARFRRAEDRERWLGARAVLRELLAGYGIADPGEPLARGPHGKPSARDPQAPRFNMSRASDDVLIVIARHAVGVDVEGPSPPGDPVALARTAFGESVAVALARLAPDRRAMAFLKRWTAYEATVKCAGTGIGGQVPDGVVASPVAMDDGRVAAVAMHGGCRVVSHRWPAPLEAAP